MLVVMVPEASEESITDVIDAMLGLGFSPSRTTGHRQTVIAGIGQGAEVMSKLLALPGVQDIYPVSKPYELVRRSSRTATGPALLFGPNAIGSRLSVFFSNNFLRGTSEAASKARIVSIAPPGLDLPVSLNPQVASFQITPHGCDVLNDDAVAFFVPGELMYDRFLIEQVAATNKPVILERCLHATIDDFLETAEGCLGVGE